MDHVPVARAHNGHVRDGEELLHVVEGGCGAGASGGRDGRGGLEAQYVGRARFAVGVEQAVHKAHEGAGGMGIVDGRAEDESVRLLGTGAKLVDGIVEDASAGLAATPARHAAGGGLGADPEDLAFDSMRIKRRGDFGKRAVGAAVLVRASVDEHDFHGASSLVAPHVYAAIVCVLISLVRSAAIRRGP